MAIKARPRTEYKRKDGTCQLLIYYEYAGERKYFKNDIKVYPEFWQGECVSRKHPRYQSINKAIDAELDRVQDVVNALKRKGYDVITGEDLEKEMFSTRKKSSGVLYALHEYKIWYRSTKSSESYDEVKGLEKKLEAWIKENGDLHFGDFSRKWFGDLAYELVTDKKYNQRRRLTNTGLKNFYALLSAFIQWSFDEGFHTNDCCKQIKLVLRDYKPLINRKEVPWDNEMKLLISHSSEDPDKLKSLDIFWWACSTAARISDVFETKISDIVNIQGQLMWAKTTNKRKSPVRVPLNKEAKIIFEKYSKGRDRGELLFGKKLCNMVGKHIKEAASKAKLERPIKREALYGQELVSWEEPLWRVVSFHTARHYFASKFMQQPGADIYTLKGYLGHKSVTTTEKYIQSIGDHTPEVGLLEFSGISRNQ